MTAIILLDFDGVILDSVSIKDEAFLSLFSNHGPETQGKAKEFWFNTRGMNRAKRIRKGFFESTNINLTEKQLTSLIDLYKKRIMSSMMNAHWVKGAIEFLSTQQHGPVFIVTAAPEEEVRSVIAKRQISQYIQGVYGGPRSKVDNIAMVFADAQREITKTIFVGDSLNDLTSAQFYSIPFLGIVKEGATSPFPRDVPVAHDLRDVDQFLN
ncbi:HAD family hydrolase [Arenicellales bacterium IMCC55707]